jgi:hypothetical protein
LQDKVQIKTELNISSLFTLQTKRSLETLLKNYFRETSCPIQLCLCWSSLLGQIN